TGGLRGLLLEGAEDGLQLVVRDPDAGVADREVEVDDVGGRGRREPDLDDDLAALDRVPDQVVQDLAQPASVADDLVGDVGVDRAEELHALAGARGASMRSVSFTVARRKNGAGSRPT